MSALTRSPSRWGVCTHAGSGVAGQTSLAMMTESCHEHHLAMSKTGFEVAVEGYRSAGLDCQSRAVEIYERRHGAACGSTLILSNLFLYLYLCCARASGTWDCTDTPQLAPIVRTAGGTDARQLQTPLAASASIRRSRIPLCSQPPNDGAPPTTRGLQAGGDWI